MDTPDPPTPNDPSSQEVKEEEPPAAASRHPFLSWPPPGLGRLQGDLWQIIKQAALGSVLLVLPLLWAAASQQEFWSLGPFGASWWVLLLTSALGLLVLLSAFVALFRVFRRSARATDQGYGWITVALVATDSQHDAGFLLQGARAYSVLPPEGRTRLLVSRLCAAGAYLCAVFWLPLGFALGVLLAARGSLTPSGLSLFTLAPAAILLVAGVVLRIGDSRTVRRARRAWFQQPWSKDLAEDEVESWNDAFRERKESPVPGTGASDTGRRLRLGGAVVLALAVLIFVPFLTLVFSTAVGPMVASVSLPDFGATQRRAGAVEAFRPYVVRPDSSISPQEAGRILHTLTFAGVARHPLPLEKPPRTQYNEPWIPDLRGGPTGIFPARWSRDLMTRAVAGLTPDEQAFLKKVAANPALDEFRTLAGAPSLDIASARWIQPFPDGTTMLDLPVPKMGAIRQASWAMVGSAALDASQGRLDQAERTLRQVISVGFLLGDDGVTILDNLTGYVLVGTGGEALESFYDATGRTAEAAALRSAQAATARTSELAGVGIGTDLEGNLRQMPGVVENASGIRGLRWEYFTLMNTLAPCLNTHKMVFGPGGDYAAWVRRAHSGLVRWPAEDSLFELARNGFFVGKGGNSRAGVLGSIFGLTLGGRGVGGSCGSVLTGVRSSLQAR